MPRLTDQDITERRESAATLRRRAATADRLAIADARRNEMAGARTWRLEARSMRRLAHELEESIRGERQARRIDAIAARLELSTITPLTGECR